MTVKLIFSDRLDFISLTILKQYTMKQLKYLLLLLAISFFSCQKEELSNLSFEDFSEEQLHNLSGPEKVFFTQGAAESKNPHVLPKLEKRSIDPLTDAALVNLYVQNIDTNYVSYIINNLGYMAWSRGARTILEDQAIIIPIINLVDDFTTGILISIPRNDKKTFDFTLLEKSKMTYGLYDEEHLNFLALNLLLFDEDIFASYDQHLIEYFEGEGNIQSDTKITERNLSSVYRCGCIGGGCTLMPKDELDIRGDCPCGQWWECATYISQGSYCGETHPSPGSCTLCGGSGSPDSTGGGTNNTGNTSPTTIISQIINRCASTTGNESTGNNCKHTELAEFSGMVDVDIIADIMTILENLNHSIISSQVYNFINSIDETDVEQVLALNQVLQYYLDNQSELGSISDFIRYDANTLMNLNSSHAPTENPDDDDNDDSNDNVYFNQYGHNGLLQLIGGKWYYERSEGLDPHADNMHYVYENGMWEKTEPTEIPPNIHLLSAIGNALVASGHLALDLFGLVPVAGEIFDGINAVWYYAEGDMVNGALSTASMVPVLGTVPTGLKLSKNSLKLTNGGFHSAEGIQYARRYYHSSAITENSLAHIYRHTVDNLTVSKHSIWTNVDEMVENIDIAYKNINSPSTVVDRNSATSISYIVDMGTKVLGKQGGSAGNGGNLTNILIVLEKDAAGNITNKIINAYPK